LRAVLEVQTHVGPVEDPSVNVLEEEVRRPDDPGSDLRHGDPLESHVAHDLRGVAGPEANHEGVATLGRLEDRNKGRTGLRIDLPAVASPRISRC